METTILIPARIRTPADLSLLRQALKSASGQGKIIIGFNNCIEEVPARMVGASCVKLEAKNLASVRNQMVKLVTTRFFFFLDHDDLLPKDVITTLEGKYGDAAKNDEYLYGSTIMFTDTSRLTIPAQEFDCEKLTRGVYFPNGVLQPTKNVEKVGPWDEELNVLEDKEWWIRGVEKGICGVPVPLVTYEYRQRGDSMTNEAKNTPAWKEALDYIRKKHANFYNGGYKMAGCCGGKKRSLSIRRGGNKPATRAAPSAPKPVQVVERKENMIQVTYLLRTAGVSFYGPVTGLRYQVSMKHPVINIDERDAETRDKSRPGLLELTKNNHRLFKRA